MHAIVFMNKYYPLSYHATNEEHIVKRAAAIVVYYKLESLSQFFYSYSSLLKDDVISFIVPSDCFTWAVIVRIKSDISI